MQRKVVFAIVIIVAICFLAYPAVAKGPSKPSGKSNVGQLNLYEKEFFDTACPPGEMGVDCWHIVDGGARGKLTYSRAGTSFGYGFTGHGLDPLLEYQLIYYPEGWPGAICIGEAGFPNNGGNLNLKGSVPCQGAGVVDAKIWLVTSADVVCGDEKMVAWNPADYLFEDALIDFECISIP